MRSARTSQPFLCVPFLAAAFLPLCGCKTAPQPVPTRADRPAPTAVELEALGLQKGIQIQSFPQGGIVELNNEYIGTTPLTLTVRTGGGATWTDFGNRAGRFVVKCSSSDGEIWEEKVWLVGQRVPDKILFRIGGNAPLMVR